jgi:hypothetical protein
MKVIEKVLVLEDYHYVEGYLNLKISGNKVYESKSLTEFNIEDILSVHFEVNKKYSPPSIPKGIKTNRVFALALPSSVPTWIGQGGDRIIFDVSFDEIICDDSYITDRGELILNRNNSVKEGNKVFSTVTLKAYGLKKIKREEIEKVTVYELFKNVEGRGNVIVSPEKQYYLKGEKVTIKASPNKGFKFLGWGGDFKRIEDNEFEIEITEDVHFDAFFEKSELGQRPATILPPSHVREGCLEQLGSGLQGFWEALGYLVTFLALCLFVVGIISLFKWYFLVIVALLLLFAYLPRIFGFLFRLPILRAFFQTLLFAIAVFGIIGLFKLLSSQGIPRTPFPDIPKTMEEPLENNSIDYTHFIEWEDYKGTRYSTTLKVNSDDVNYEKKVKESISNIESIEEYNTLLARISNVSEQSLYRIIQSLDSIKKSNRISDENFANVIVSMVQHIPYYVILPQTCNPSDYQEPAIRAALLQAPCQGYIAHGIKTPAEFLKDLKGDCDSRTLFLYTLLKYYGYEVGVFGSEYYNHSLLGISNYPSEGSYKEILGKRYYLWETTSKGFKRGDVSQEIRNMTYWKRNLN